MACSTRMQRNILDCDLTAVDVRMDVLSGEIIRMLA